MKYLKPKEKITYYAIMIIVSLVAIIYGFMNNNDYLNGFGFGLGTVSIIFLIKQIILMRDAKKIKDEEIRNNDERNIKIAVYSYAFSFRVSIFIEALATVIFAIINKVYISEIFGLLICIQLILYIIGIKIFTKKN